ncbi:MAG: hypothetical protein AB1709_10290, partial [Bacillota bacterium]
HSKPCRCVPAACRSPQRIRTFQPNQCQVARASGGKQEPSPLARCSHTLRVQGYRFVTVDELLGIPAYRN